jgi:RNA polymerase primary sigma factor
VELLSREGEIAIAKRIEAGRETMIEGLCESPLTFQAIIIWREQLAEGEILLRDIIDLEATYAGPDAKQATPTAEVLSMHQPKPEPVVAKPAPAARRPGGSDDDYVPEEPQAPQDPAPDDDYDEFDNALSLSAMEAELKPQVV